MSRKEITRSEYYRRIGLVLDYIYNHLDEDLSLDKIAKVACFSAFHWHRIYQTITHENIASTIRRLRLQRAARTLAKTDISVPRIAQWAGYTHPDAFIRKFTQDFGISPAQYRKQSVKLMLSNQYQPQLEALPLLSLAAVEHQGDYLTMGVAFARLRLLGEQQGFLTNESRALGVFYEDPTIVNIKELRSKACFTLHGNDHPSDDAEHLLLPPQVYATIIHQGPHHELDDAYRWLYGDWLLNSGYEPADKPVVEEYLNSPRLVSPKDLLTKIYLPIHMES